MVSDADIVRRLNSVLRKADLSVTTVAAIRKQLEKELGVDLTEKKAFIREQVDIYLGAKEAQAQQQHYEEAGEGEGDEVDGEAAGEEEQEEEKEDEQELGGEVVQEEEAEQEDEEEVEQIKPVKRTRQSTHEPDSKRFKAKIDRAIKASLPKEKKKRTGGGGGLTKACGLSPELQAIIGEPELPRTQVVKQLWVYIRENELQDPENRRKILCNDELRGLFGVDSTDIFKMNKLLSRHIWPLDKPADGEPKVKKPKAEKAVTEKVKTDRKESDKPKKENDRQKTEKKENARGRSNQKPLPLSEALMEFLGTDEEEMDQHEVVKAIWDYITANKLQDPADKKTIICDEKLQDLFGCETVVGYSITKLLAPHLKGLEAEFEDVILQPDFGDFGGQGLKMQEPKELVNWADQL